MRRRPEISGKRVKSLFAGLGAISNEWNGILGC